MLIGRRHAARCETQVINEQLGIVHGCITTVHDVTGTQPIIDMAMTKKKVSLHGRSSPPPPL